MARDHSSFSSWKMNWHKFELITSPKRYFKIRKFQSAGTYKEERLIVGQQSAEIHVNGQPRPLLNFCANNYLGLSSHPSLIEAAKQCLNSHGAGLSSVRFICGTQASPNSAK